MRVLRLFIFIQNGFFDDTCGCVELCAFLKNEYISYNGQKNENKTASVMKDIFHVLQLHML